MTDGQFIRQLTKDDWEAFEVLDQASFPDDRIIEKFYMLRIENEGCFGLFANDQLVGQLIIALFGDDAGHIGRVAVAPEYRGEGYGSVLMKYAIEWFKQRGGVNTIHLYTPQDNYTAQGLYKKFGFAVAGTTWHHIVPRSSLNPTGRYTCQEIREDEIERVGEKYPALPAGQIRRFLTDERFHVMTLKDNNGDIIGACRFTPGFPGCFPYLMDTPEAFDDFLAGLEPFSLPKFDHVRITYTDMPEVAKMCDARGYTLHHKLFKLTLTLTQ